MSNNSPPENRAVYELMRKNMAQTDRQTDRQATHDKLMEQKRFKLHVRVIRSRKMRWAGNVARMGEGRGVCRVLGGKHEGKKPLERPRRGWEANIKTAIQQVGCGLSWLRIETGGGHL
jgi:hypothetical protein